MKFKQYLIEGRTKKIDVYKALDLIKKNCSHALKQWQTGTKIYRGIEDFGNDFGFIDGKTSHEDNRRSRNTANYYTLIMNNGSQWKRFPDRNIICTTDRTKADYYGDVYHMFPYNGSKIGVASDHDIWYSFTSSLNGELLNSFNASVEKILSVPDVAMRNKKMGYFGDMEGTYDNSWRDFKKACDNFDEWYDLAVDETLESWAEDAEDEGEKPNTSRSDARESMKEIIPSFWDYKGSSNLPESMLDKYKDDIMKTFESFLNPSKNGIKLVKAGQSIPDRREVWLDGKCVMVSSNVIKMNLSNIYSELQNL